MTQRISSRRLFLQTAGVLTGSGLVNRYAPAALLEAFQQSALDARRAQVGAAPIETATLTDRLTLLTGPGGNVLVFHGPDGKIVVDGFVKPVWPKLKAAIDALGASPIKSMIDTHWHFDHADNNGNARRAGAGVIAHENTRTRLTETHVVLGIQCDPVPSGELPTQTFAAGLTLNFNGEQVDLQHVAPAHTDSDILVFFPKANVLHMGDVFFNGFYPFIDAGTGGHIDGMIAGAQAGLKKSNAQTKIVPGHGPLASRGALEAYAGMLTNVRDQVRKMKGAGKTLAEVQAAKPTASLDAAWAKGLIGPDAFVALVYNTVR